MNVENSDKTERIEPASFHNPVVIGLHIPKCAGTTFTANCRKHMPTHLFYGNSDPVGFHTYLYPEFTTLDFHRVGAIFGHFVFEEMLPFIPTSRAVVLFTGLREPVKRTRSEFYFVRKFAKQCERKPPVFQRWVNNPNHHNSMCKYLVTNFPSFIHRDATKLSEKAISILQKFDLVYDSASFNRDIAPIYQLLGIKAPTRKYNITTKHEKIPVSEDQIREYNSEDVALYEYFTNHPELIPDRLGALQKRTLDNHQRRASLLGCDPDLPTIYQKIYQRKRGVYVFTGNLNRVIADKTSQLHGLTHEIACYAQESNEAVLSHNERVIIGDAVKKMQALIRYEDNQSDTDAKQIKRKKIIQQEKFEKERHALQQELNTIYASRGYRVLEQLRKIWRRIF